MIFYFSGTGNSRYAAQQLAALTGDTAQDIADYVRSGTGDTFRDDRPFVFVAPVYVAAPALSLLDFLKNSSFQGNKKAYFVMTCAGTMSGSPAFCRKAAEEKGLEYMGTAQLKLPQNYIAYFTMKSVEENGKIIAAAQPVLENATPYRVSLRSMPCLSAVPSSFFNSPMGYLPTLSISKTSHSVQVRHLTQIYSFFYC